MPVIGSQGPPDRAGPAEPLKPIRNLAVVQVQVVAAVAADELEKPGTAWVALARSRLAPQHCHQAMAELARRDHVSIRGIHACVLAVALRAALPRVANAGYVAGRPLADRRISIWWIHSTRPQGR